MKASDVTVTAVKQDESSYVVYEGDDWSLFQESVFIDFGDEDDPEAIIQSLIFEAPGMETIVYDLEIKDKFGQGCMVEYDLIEENTSTRTCETCQVGQHNIAVQLSE